MVPEFGVSKWRQISEWQKANPRKGKPPPEAIPPLLPTLVKSIPEGDRWLHEVKWDGYRIIVQKDERSIRIFTRNLHDWTGRFPTIVQAVGQLGASEATIDGEAVVMDERGLSSFSAIQAALGSGGRKQDILLVAFDLLKLNDEDLRQRRFLERRAALLELLGEPPPSGIMISEAFEDGGPSLYEHACRLGMEGIVSKLRDSVYVSGRRREWVKTKCVKSGDFIAIGYETGKSYGGLRSVILAKVEDGKLVHAGSVGTGFNSQTDVEMRRCLDAIRAERSPIPTLKVQGATWARPEIIVEVEFTGWTAEGQLRHPSFKGIREDRTAAESGIAPGIDSHG